jgi:hypothetical protein
MPWLDVQRSHEQYRSGFARFGAELTELWPIQSGFSFPLAEGLKALLPFDYGS